jgi:hypothetical protein
MGQPLAHSRGRYRTGVMLQGAALKSYNQAPRSLEWLLTSQPESLSSSRIRGSNVGTRPSCFSAYQAAPVGREVKQHVTKLHNARQECLDDGILVDSLGSAEHLHYVHLLSLLPAQSAQLLATLSSNSLASDDYLRTLTPMGEADRRASVAGPKSGDGGRTGGGDNRVPRRADGAGSDLLRTRTQLQLRTGGAQPYETECQPRFGPRQRNPAAPDRSISDMRISVPTINARRPTRRST